MTVLVPVDGSEPAWRAATVAFRESPDAEFLVLYVVDPYRAVVAGGLEDVDSSMDRARADAERTLEEIEDLATGAGVDVEIVERAGEGFDHVGVGSHGRSGLDRLLLGSVAEAVVRRAPVTVTVVP